MCDTNGAEIASHLRNSCVPTQNGKFVEADKDISAIYLQQLGEYYLTQTDQSKLSYLYSAALFSAARQRNPGLETMAQSSMRQLWKKLMISSGSCRIEDDIDEIVVKFKERVADDRETARLHIARIPGIADETPDDQRREKEKRKVEIARDVFSDVTTRYVDFMAHISRRCCDILFASKPPCDFAHVALGSVARLEVTPFSDFESIILLDNSLRGKENESDIVEQFRWYSVIFQVLIINLGETPIRLLGIPLLNDFASGDRERDWFYDKFTKCGIQFDSNMPGAGVHPLSNKSLNRDLELIATVDRMLSYLDENFVGGNSYHLASSLWVSRFVSGCENLHREFRRKVVEKLANSRGVVKSKIKETMAHEDAIDEFTEDLRKKNIKRLIYRGITATVSHLGSYFGVQGNSCYDVIDQLLEKGKITAEASHNLKFAVALTCEVRNKIYLQSGQQVAVTELGKEGILYSVIEGVGKTSICDLYDITHSLWLTLYAFIVRGKPFGVLDLKRRRKNSLLLCIRANLFDEFESGEKVKVAPLDPKSFIYVLKDGINHLLKALEGLQLILPKVTHLDMEKLTRDFEKLQIALKIAREMLRDLKIGKSSPEYIIASTLLEGNDEAFAAYCNGLSKGAFSIGTLFTDDKLVKVYPDLMILIFFISDFVTNLRSLLARPVDTKSLEITIKNLDSACQMLTRFTKTLSSFDMEEQGGPKNEGVSFMTRKLDHGLFDTTGMLYNVRRAMNKLKMARASLLVCETLGVPAHMLAHFTESYSAPLEQWSVFLSTWLKAVVRDAFLLIAELKLAKANLLRRKLKFEIARNVSCHALELLRSNSRRKVQYQRLVARALRSVGKCYLLSFRYSLALEYFREEFRFRNDHWICMWPRDRKANVKNCYNRVLCLEGMNTPASMLEAAKLKDASR